MSETDLLIDEVDGEPVVLLEDPETGEEQPFRVRNLVADRATIDGGLESPLRQVPTNYDMETASASRGARIVPLDVEEWTVLDGHAERTDDAYFGNRAIRLRKAADETRSRIAHAFDSPKDLRERDFCLIFKTTAALGDPAVAPRVWLFDAAGNVARFRSRIHPAMLDTWFVGNLNVADGGHDAGFDWSAVERVQVRNPAGGDAEWYFGGLRAVEKAAKGYVMFGFDDSNETDYSEAFPILGNHGLTGCSFHVVERLADGGWDDPERTTLEKLNEMQARGWEHCVHAWRADHPSYVHDLEGEALREDMAQAKRWLRQHGFWRGARCLRYPYSHADTEAHATVRDYYSLSFRGRNLTGGGPRMVGTNSVQMFAFPDDEAHAKEMIDLAVEHRHLCGINLHGVGDELTAAELDNVAAYAREKAADGVLEVITPSDLIDRNDIGP